MKKEYWGYHLIVNLGQCNPDIIRSKEKIEEFVIKLCDLIKMKRFGECIIIHFGEEERVAGYSMFQLIETSNISAHFANESNAVYLDIFSCKEYDIQETLIFAIEFFDAKTSNHMFLNRQA